MAIYLPIVSEFKPAGVDAATRAIDGLNKKTGRIGGGFKKAGKVAKVGLLGMAGGAAAAGYAGMELAKAAAEDSAAAAQLARQLKNTTDATDTQIASVEDFISKTSRASGVADDELRPALATLVRGSGDIEKAQSDLALAMDISAATGKDVESVSGALSKAYGGSTTALGRLDPALAKVIKKGGTTEDLFGRLGKTFKGAGKEAAKSAQGQFKRLGVAFEEAKESLGEKLLPALTGVVDFLNEKVIPIVDKVIKVFDKEGLAGVWDLVVDAAKEALPKVLSFLGDLAVKVKDKLLEMGQAFLEWIGPRIKPMLKQLGELIGKAANWLIEDGLPLLVDKLKEWGKAFVEWVGPQIVPMLKELGKLLLKIGEWIITKAVPAIALAVGELAVAFLGWIGGLAVSSAKKLGEFIADLIPKLPGLFLSLIVKMGEMGQKLGGAIIGGLVTMFRNVGSFAADIGRDIVNAVIGFVNRNVIDKINGALEFKVLGVTVDAPDIPPIPTIAMARGGIVTGPTTALIGEAGPEAVIPLSRLGGLGGDTINITVNGALDPVTVARQIRNLLNEDGRRRTGGPILA